MKTFTFLLAPVRRKWLAREHAFLVLRLALAVNPLFAAFDPVAWKLGGLRGVVVGPANDEHPFQSEGTTVKLRDGTLLHAFNLRYGEKDMSQWHPHYARTVIAKVLSRDGGRTWSAPAAMFESNTGFNASHAAVRRLPNGELGATYQRINTKPVEQWDRENWIRSIRNADKVFRYSQDEGKTWSEEILISPDTGYWTSAHDRVCYPSIFFDAGFAHIGYWAGARVEGRQYDQQYMMVLPVSFFTALRETHRPAAIGLAR